MTGFQKHLFTFKEIMTVLKATLGSGNKMMFLQNRLTGALDHYKFGSDVSMLCSLRVYRTVFDTKRVIVQLEGDDEILYSKPFANTEQAHLFRNLIGQLKTGVYSSTFTDRSTFSSKDIRIETITYFIRLCLQFVNFNPTINQKYDIIEIIKLALQDSKIIFNDQRIMKLINSILFNKGVIMNNLNYYSESAELVLNLQKALGNCSSFNTFNQSIFLNLFLNKFINFFPYPSISPCLNLVVIDTTKPSLFEENYLAGIDILTVCNKIRIMLDGLPMDSQLIAKSLIYNEPVKVKVPVTIPNINFNEILNSSLILENEIKSLEMELEFINIKLVIFKSQLLINLVEVSNINILQLSISVLEMQIKLTAFNLEDNSYYLLL
jgi:hypothetical protein